MTLIALYTAFLSADCRIRSVQTDYTEERTAKCNRNLSYPWSWDMSGLPNARGIVQFAQLSIKRFFRLCPVKILVAIIVF